MNQKLINDLREGRIVLKNEPKNPEAVKAILKEAWPEQSHHNNFYNSEFYAASGIRDLPKIKLADFLIPEPRFKKGDRVIYSNDISRIEEVERVDIEGTIWIGKFISINESSIDGWRLATPEEIKEAASGTITETQTLCGTEQQFEVGKQYEFSDPIEDGWAKGVLLAIIEDDYKYIARIGNDREPSGWQLIRPIQPKDITKEDLAGLLSDWIELSDDAIVIGGSYLDVHENLYHKSKSILDQLRTEGVIS